MKPLHFIHRNLRTVLASVAIIYFVLLYLLLNDIPWYSSVSKFIRRQEISSNSKRLELLTTRYWKLTRESIYNFENSTSQSMAEAQWNISKYAVSIENLWPDNVYTNSLLDHNDRILEQLIWILEAARHPEGIQKLKTKKIMLLDSKRWWNIKSNEEFKKICPGFSNKCEFIDRDNRTIFGYKFTRADIDAVVIVKDFYHRRTAINLGPDVLRFYYIMETGHTISAFLNKSTDILDSYWRGSNIVTPYGKWVYCNASVKSRKQDKNFATGKSELAAVVVSNCRGPNGRMKYIKALQKYADVHVYGSCGKLKCPRQGCFEKLKKRYKFYLAFENSNCRDYITEKFFENSLRYDMVPVVLGAHPNDYKAAAPQNSYINVEDFDTPEELAKYLIYLDKNDTAYNEYFAWKETGELIDTKFLCRVCAMTHYADHVPPPKRNEVFRWGSIEKHKLCLPRHKMFWKNFNI